MVADIVGEIAELGLVNRHEREQGGGRVVVEDGGAWVGGDLHTRYFGLGGGCYLELGGHCSGGYGPGRQTARRPTNWPCGR